MNTKEGENRGFGCGKAIRGIALAAILLASIFGALAPAYARDSTGAIERGDIVYRGERGLDVSAIIASGGIFWGIKDTIADGALIVVSDNTNFNVPVAAYVGPYNKTSREGTVADIVIDKPVITGDVFIEGTVDSIVGKSIPAGTNLTIRVNTNFGGIMKNAADGNWSKVKIRLIDPHYIYMQKTIDADAQEITIGTTAGMNDVVWDLLDTTDWYIGTWKMKVSTDKATCNEVDISSPEYEFTVNLPNIVTICEPIEINASPKSILADGISTSNITIAVFWPKIEDYPELGEIEGYEILSGTPAAHTPVIVGTTLGVLTDAEDMNSTGADITVYTGTNGTATVFLSGSETGVADITARATGIEVMMNDIVGNETTVYIVKNSTTVTFLATAVFDTGSSVNPYPSIFGMHNGTITLYSDLNVSTLYTYPCPGTGGHTEYARIWNSSWVGVEARWNGYTGDGHYIYFDEPFMLVANETYNYTIRTGSYPQIIHESPFNATGGVITCTSFEDVNGIIHNDWIPAVRLD